jgi:hypothetical protein
MRTRAMCNPRHACFEQSVKGPARWKRNDRSTTFRRGLLKHTLRPCVCFLHGGGPFVPAPFVSVLPCRFPPCRVPSCCAGTHADGSPPTFCLRLGTRPRPGARRAPGPAGGSNGSAARSGAVAVHLHAARLLPAQSGRSLPLQSPRAHPQGAQRRTEGTRRRENPPGAPRRQKGPRSRSRRFPHSRASRGRRPCGGIRSGGRARGESRAAGSGDALLRHRHAGRPPVGRRAQVGRRSGGGVGCPPPVRPHVACSPGPPVSVRRVRRRRPSMAGVVARPIPPGRCALF